MRPLKGGAERFRSRQVLLQSLKVILIPPKQRSHSQHGCPQDTSLKHCFHARIVEPTDCQGAGHHKPTFLQATIPPFLVVFQNNIIPNFGI
mmetsp:Transcript_47688/g.132775  ORF Transcript_47688/g.132775 Transcript_47688/m.132775 type:complete len:91 (+) Transcript_47688:95-367(+)